MHFFKTSFAIIIFMLSCSLSYSQDDDTPPPGGGGGGGGGSQDPDVYTNFCGGYNNPGAEPYRYETLFNDPDGDCISSDWVITTFFTDGRNPKTVKDEDWRAIGLDPTINFGELNCCTQQEIIGGSGGINCNWNYDIVTATLEILCEEGEHD